MASIPQLQTRGLQGGTVGPNAAPPTPHKLSGRRLSKSVMRSDSQNAEGSKGWGMCEVRTDGSGTTRAVRVVQKAEKEDFNMYKITWLWTVDDKTFQVDLRHGRRSGIRKLYVNKELVERVHRMKDMVADSGSTHRLALDKKHEAVVRILPKSSISGFTYQLEIDGNPIEQNLAGPMAGGNLDIGERTVTLPKAEDGLGMTLRNNPLGTTGVVVWTLERGKAAAAAGILPGDVVLSVHDEIVNDIGPLTELVAKGPSTHVNMELAGAPACRRRARARSAGGRDK